MQELQDIPDDKLAELYDIIHYFCLGLIKETVAEHPEHQPGLLKGSLGEVFLMSYQKMNSKHGNKLSH